MAKDYKVTTPWKSTNEDSVFWQPLDIKADRWNLLFPYRLVVVDITKQNKIYGGSGIAEAATSSISDSGSGAVTISQQIVSSSKWEYRLPITPQQLQVVNEYAVNLTATGRGITEEHNGVKFKQISASGTTGIWPQRPKGLGAPSPLNSAQSIFSGTISSFNNLSSGISSTISRATNGDHPQTAAEAKPPENEQLEETGYFHAMMLGEFLDRYVEEKKKAENKDLRLVFDMPKQNKSYIVTPKAFTLKQSAMKPNEHMWSIQMTAWKRIDLASSINVGGTVTIPNVLDNNTYQKMLRTLTGVRANIGAATDLIKAVRSDFLKPFNILRQLSLIVKDLGGFVFTVADFPVNLINDATSAISDALATAASAFTRPTPPPKLNFLQNAASIVATSTSAKDAAGAAVSSILQNLESSEGLSQQAVKDGALGAEAALTAETSQSNEAFSAPEENFELFNEVNIDTVKLSQPQKDAVQTELDSIRLINIDQLGIFKEEIQSLITDIADNFGAGSDVLADVYGLPAPKPRVTPMSIEENEILIDLMEVIQILNDLTATKKFDDKQSSSSLEFVGGLASESGISFDTTQNKFLVPIPFGSSIEEIAARYLGDPDKFVEIATLNNLRSPYIDEIGFTYNLLSNADGRRFNVENSDNNIYIGQKLTLSSTTINPFIRKVISVDKISDFNYLITVDGEADLVKLTTNDNAVMQGYLPGTVNSQNQLYIPTNSPSPEDDRVETISHLDEPALTKISKVDFLLTEDNDIALNSVGDFRLSNGLTNLIQSLKLKINTKKGSLLRHLEYGLGLKHGLSIADVNNGEIIKELNKMISDDARFESIKRLEITLNGPTLRIDMEVSIVNFNGVVPVSFDIQQ